MSNLKVLKLSYWMLPRKRSDWEQERQSCLSRYKQLTPIVNKPGRYKLGKQAWFEVDGKAYSDNMFDYDLSLLEASEYNSRQVAALQAVVEQKLATKQQANLLHMCNQVAYLRKLNRSAGRWKIRAKN